MGGVDAEIAKNVEMARRLDREAVDFEAEQRCPSRDEVDVTGGQRGEEQLHRTRPVAAHEYGSLPRWEDHLGPIAAHPVRDDDGVAIRHRHIARSGCYVLTQAVDVDAV
jgi:hypothetical protein